MDIPPEIFATLPKKIWKPYKIRNGLRQLKELRTGKYERRGRKKQYDDEDFIRTYIEIEARAQILTDGFVFRLLKDPRLRLIQNGDNPVRLDRQDRQTLRRRHMEGKREAREWYMMKFMGRPHYKWNEIQRRIEARVEDLRFSEELLFLKKV